ncbi:MAG: long-chain fatty acid--CoA ligase, partial [Conexibacter sp.]|nr:long-chain fatty acid--CoA ligase [Conexibacter sp.]
ARSLTFAELEDEVGALASGLAARGLSGATVAWMLPNAPEAIVTALALARVGAVAVPLNDRLTAEELAFIAEDAGIDLQIGGAGGVAVEELRGVANPWRAWPVEDDAVATLIYTSGTTGFPKGVVRTHRANAWNVVNSALGDPRTAGDVELFTLPAFGIGLLHFALPALLGGATVVLDGAFDAERVWALLGSGEVTRTFLAPTMMSAMLAVDGHERHDLSALRTICTAYELGDGLRARVLARFGDVFTYMYGLTEAQLTCTRPGDFTAKPGSVGGAMGALRIRVLDAAGAPLPAGEVGEIALEGPSLMAGYHQRPDETAAALQDGWLRTGDLGLLDADGDLHYRGRLKEMIKTGGFSVDPREVEHVLAAVAGVADAAVVGVPDEHWGEMVVAFVATDGAVEEAALLAACRAHLAGYKVPKQLRLLDALPLNATGKVARGALRASYRSVG